MAAEDVGSTSEIRNWHSIITLIVFVLTNINVLFPFQIPCYVPRPFTNAIRSTLSALRIISPRPNPSQHDHVEGNTPAPTAKPSRFVRLNFPMNFVTAPLIADLFLLAIGAIGRQEWHDGTVGADNISPISIMAFFFTLAYIAISIDASGLIRWLAFKVLQKGGKVGHQLFFYLYLFFFGLGVFIGNDPIILSGTAFLAYMTRVSKNIMHPRAWIHTQFAVANIASAVLVSSNPTNLVLAGAFNIKFIVYTANMIVPVVVTAIVLFPFLLYFVFADKYLIPLSIEIHELSEEAKTRDPVNPNIPNARGNAEEDLLQEIMRPWLDKKGAFAGAAIMAVTLVTVLVLNAVSNGTKERPVYWVTLPAAFVMLCFDLATGWRGRENTRAIARKGREEIERAQAEEASREEEEKESASQFDMQSRGRQGSKDYGFDGLHASEPHSDNNISAEDDDTLATKNIESSASVLVPGDNTLQNGQPSTSKMSGSVEKRGVPSDPETIIAQESSEKDVSVDRPSHQADERPTLVSLSVEFYTWSRETFPTVVAVIEHLPFALLPFALTMFVLVQALVTKGWVPVFAHGWDHWVNKTGTVGAIGGMAFLSVILCNFAGTNIGTTILLSRVIQAWQKIHKSNGIPITDRTFWATVYSMALGVNYGAFSIAFSASLAGLLWRDILARKFIHVKAVDFARVNLPIIGISMAVGCAVLTGEVYIIRNDSPYNMG